MHIIQQIGYENTQTYQVEVVVLIYHLILVTHLQGNVQQLEGRINNQTLGVKRLNGFLSSLKLEILITLVDGLQHGLLNTNFLK